MICKQCGHELYTVKNLTEYDHHDGIREARYCNNCHILFSSHAHGLNKIATLSTKTEKQLQSKNAALLQQLEDTKQCYELEIRRLNERLARLVGSARRVVKISDRKHDAWDELKQAIAEAEVKP
jgi:transcriptional regulator NrdR family protein